MRKSVCNLATELTGVWHRRWNDEIFIIFQLVILQRNLHVLA